MNKFLLKKHMKRVSALGMVLTTAVNMAAYTMPVDAASIEKNLPSTASKNVKAKTNVVYIVLDDMGFSDFGCYGSEIKTPNIDKLAENGLRYNNFNVCPVCSPTRAALLTGRDNHTVGMGSLASVDLGPGNPSLRARITDKAATVSQILKSNGYSTMAVGKWHLAPLTAPDALDYWPLGKGFEHFYGFIGGETDQFDPILVSDNHSIDTPKDKNYQFSNDMLNVARQYLADQASLTPDKPFFLYASFSAVHSPLQAPQKYIDMYNGVYDKGWDKIREERFARQKQMGIIPADAELTPNGPFVKPWDSLTADEKRLSTRFMQTYAGYLTYTDEQIGRLTDYLKTIGQFDNTMIVIISDNGATGGGPSGTDFDQKAFNLVQPSASELLPKIDQIGGPELKPIYPDGWANVSNTPFQGYKYGVYNGGTRAPLIVHWPNVIKDKGQVRTQYVHAVDITATVLDALDVKAPTSYQGIEQLPLDGQSMAYSFDKPDAPSQHNVQYYLFWGNRSIYKDGWKAIATHKRGTTYEQDTWELYNDYSEMHNVAAQYPDKLKELQDLWQEEAKKHGAPLTDIGPGGKRVDSKNHFIFYPESSSMGSGVAPDINNKSYTITVPISRTDKSQEGVLVSLGESSMGGYTLFVQNNRLVYELHRWGKVTRIESSEPLPTGSCVVKYKFEKTGPFTGIGRLVINDKIVGEKIIPRTLEALVDDSFDIGCDRHEPVSDSYRNKGHFNFTGQFDYVMFDIQNVQK